MAGERILIVEDERAVARGLEYGLSSEGFTVLWADTGQRALELARTGPHLILLDIRLPDGDGLDIVIATVVGVEKPQKGGAQYGDADHSQRPPARSLFYGTVGETAVLVR